MTAPLLDQDLTGIDGTEVFNRIKRDPALARSVAREMERARKAGDLDAVKAQMAGLKAQFDHLKHAVTNG